MSNAKRYLVGGSWRESNHVVAVRFSYSDEVVAEIFDPQRVDMEDSIQAALRGFEVMRRLPAYRRGEILEKLEGRMRARRSEVLEALCLEGSKTRAVCVGEFERSCQTVKVASEEARRISGEVIGMDWAPAGENCQGISKRFPMGIMLGITPFNYPLNLACHKVGPAIAAGNSVILKPDPETPLTSLLLGEMLLEAGMPPEAVSVLPASAELAEQMVTDPRIAILSFTGSSKVGWRLREQAGRKKVLLELGGNAPVIIHDDANIEYATDRIAIGGFTHSGQNCISVQRVLVQERRYEDVLTLLTAKVGALTTGDPRDEGVDVGPLIRKEEAVRAQEWVEEAVQEGAVVAVGGIREGALLQPTVLAGGKADMKISCQEIFAPVVSVRPYAHFEDALDSSNNTEYGLQAGVFTNDIHRIMQAYDCLEFGGVQINDVSTFRMDHSPYGGVKASGFGREGVKYTIEEMTEPKLMVIHSAKM